MAGLRHDAIVRGDFALERDAFADHPHDRVEPKETLDDALHHIGVVVVTTKMRVLVHDEVFDRAEAFVRRKLGRDEDDGPPETDRDGCLDLVTQAEIDFTCVRLG